MVKTKTIEQLQTSIKAEFTDIDIHINVCNKSVQNNTSIQTGNIFLHKKIFEFLTL